MAVPMDEPAAATHSGSTESAARKTRALVSGETLSIGGEPFLVAADNIHHAQLLLTLMGGFPRAASAFAARFRLTATAPPCPNRPADHHYESIDEWRDGHDLWVRHTSGTAGWATPNAITIGGTGDIEEPLRRLFLPLIAHLLGHRNVFALHAGAIDAGDGAMLVLGSSGSGKSTLVGLSLSRSWQALGDDVVALVPNGADDVSIIGIARPPAIPADALGAPFRESAPRDPRGRIHLDPRVLDTRPHKLIGTVLPYRAESSHGTIEKVMATDLLHEVVASFPSASNPGLLSRLMPIAGRVARMNAYRLPIARTGADRFNDAGLHLDDVALRIRDGRP